MKAQVCDSQVSSLPTIRSGKVSKGREEDFEVALYLDKLRHLLPTARSRKSLDKKLNRLEVIESVIQYISELQEVLNIDVHDREMDLLEYETSSITLAA
ncbi:protein extra-macrochaetae-like [Cherax quadricarinatus]|uniref:protein extra-macrochaetae-like n=1 Tax=Cherax quadricarinatus TaxID=27406 RepID=UPI00387E6E9B